MKQIILDTNFLLIPSQFGVDIFSEIDRLMQVPYELCIIDSTMDELKKIQETASGSDKRAAGLAIQFIEKKGIRPLKTEKNLNTDKLIVERAKNADCIVATQDKALKRILKEKNAQLIVLRQKSHLEFF